MALDMSARKNSLDERIRLVDIVIAPSEFLSSVYRSVFPGLDIVVQHHGHDLSWLQRVGGDEVNDGTSLMRFSYIGQLTADKGVDVLIRAFRKLESRSRSVVLDIWGGSDNQSSYLQLLKDLAQDDDRISFQGRFNRQELRAVLDKTDVVVVPSIWYENNPLVIQEAFAAGVPVIASDLGGMKEFVQDGINGLLFPAGDSVSLSGQMMRLVDDYELVDRLRQATPPVKTIQSEVDQLMKIYLGLTGLTRNSIPVSNTHE